MVPKVSHVRDTQARLVSETWPWAEAERDRIAAHWKHLCAERPSLFDGRVLIMRRGGIVDGVFRAEYSETAYSSFIAWRDWGSPDNSVRNGFSMAALRAKDGAFVLGVMGDHTSNAGKIYFPAGTPDPSDVTDGMVDLAGSVERELAEETGLTGDDVQFAPDFTVIEQGQRVAFLRETLIADDGAHVAARIRDWLAQQDEPELADVHVVRSMRDVDAAHMPDFLVTYFERVFSGG